MEQQDQRERPQEKKPHLNPLPDFTPIDIEPVDDLLAELERLRNSEGKDESGSETSR